MIKGIFWLQVLIQKQKQKKNKKQEGQSQTVPDLAVVSHPSSASTTEGTYN